MAKKSHLPRLTRVDFYRLKEGELISALFQALLAHAEKYPTGKWTTQHLAIFAWAKMVFEVPNGGFSQFFYNHRGDSGVNELADLLDLIQLPKAASLIRDAVVLYRKNKKKFAVANPWEGLFSSIKEFDILEDSIVNLFPRCERALETWIRSHITELATDESGRPIDSQFTGSVEILQPNGLVGESLEVKNGRPNGAYREYFNDGTMRKVIFYRSGKVTGDFWPNGQLKRKESKKGDNTIIEWYYPSGKLQKQYIKDKSGYPSEPIRLFHENGQLAEEISQKNGERFGPWLKFFEDGSPRLRAEYSSKGKLIVHEAWNLDRVQVVKKGTGVYYDDGINIDWEYSVFNEFSWQSETELKGGIPHGRVTSWHNGILWSVSQIENDVLNGKSTSYWDNGRIRDIRTFVKGKETKSDEFPKFDQPLPAVLLRVEANEKLYSAWEHIMVDQYPQVLNLDKVQRQLKVPDFLREVHERNLAGKLKDNYEDCNSFEDGIAYFLTVNPAGEVTSATPNGSGVYSGGEWDTYPPFLLKLRFNPGYLRGHAIECRVLARVVHTFIEGKTNKSRK